MADKGRLNTRLSSQLAALRQQVTTLHSYLNVNRRSVGIRSTSRDNPKRKQAQDAVRESEERYRFLFENANDAIATFTLDGLITSVNRGAELMVGWSREELIGHHVRKVATPASVALADERARRFLAGEKLPSSTFEADLMCKDGSVVPVEARTRAIRDKEGKPIGFQGIYRDISARKALERQRAEFLSMLTHDVKSPLGVILGYSEVLLEKVREQGSALAEEEDVLEKLRSSVLTIDSLITNYLDLSRIETGQLPLAMMPLAINHTLRRVGLRYKAEARYRRISLELQLQQELPVIAGDPLALERVFANLMDNALRFTPEPGRVRVSSAWRNSEVVVAVADTGPGVAPEEIPGLFEKYQRAAASQHRKGSGLGLFIVKALVEAHRGRVEVESNLGSGSCFSVFLPITPER